MDNFEEIVHQLTKRWGGTTMAEFRDEAVLEDNGTLYDSVRVQDGPRIILMICVTNPEQIAIVEKAFKLDEEMPVKDWTAHTLVEWIFHTVQGVGLSYEDLHDAYGKRTAVLLCATRPESVRVLETFFKMPT
jgi:hypothetical protein